MSYQCAACKRAFSEAGFCPFDGTKLIELSDTLPAVAGPSDQTAIRAVSAKAGEAHGDVMDSIRRRVSEYDRLLGETLDGRYLVQRKIGEGGMGVVFAVKHTVIERPLAIKVLKREVMRDEATVKRFIQEARAASRIGHPNIVDVTDFGSTDGMTYQVMELIDGVTLSRVTKTEAPLPLERVLRIGSQIARALVAAHAKGIVHRDLKPENVFLTEREGRPDFVKIVDFGIAKVQPVDGPTDPNAPRLTRAGSVFGTPEYMAPEQAAGRNDTDHRVDVYALGVILYEMLVGKVPFKGDSMIRTIAMQMLDPVVPPSKANPGAGIRSDIEAIVMKALAKKREDRYATMAQLLTALEGVSVDAHTIPDISPPILPTTVTETAQPPRRAKPPTRPLHEPQFVDQLSASRVARSGNAGDGPVAGPVSFSHVYDGPPPDMERRSRWPMLLAGLAMLVLGAGGAVLLIMKLGDREAVVTAPRPTDAAVISELADAPILEAPVDALAVVDVPVDAGVRVTTARRDAGVTTGALPRPVDRKGNVTIEVMTRPGDANVFIGKNYRGPSGVRITEKYGAKLKIECKTERMKGSIEVLFDGNLTAVMCTATRDRFCVSGLKNPYDDCEEEPL